MHRSRLILLIALGVLIFLALSAVLTRALSVDGAERAAITTLVQDEARGDTSAVVQAITGCGADAACQDRTAATVNRLRHPGPVSVIQIQTSSSFSLTSTSGTARVAWNVDSSLPIVQCLKVRHAGNAVSGLSVELLRLSARIPSDADCPATF